ncbi:baseplate J/gp47 family protein [Novosphingobium sp. EMRT-2]|uniref:baseplate assembly protein n=1 Tax=Novosphingobium sp. EMRT-2 TaxID=2571749 RepID=UPI0010BD0859|nr:baseplate J/gp47 family protein [Novosphingobium sp. EMRT-2]QCI92892.1 baseplate assembly protein [Novosphingobium sp. EMRT-2]
MPIASDSFTGVDLSRLPAPSVVEELDFETILAANLAWFTTAIEAEGGSFDATVKSDPVVLAIHLFSYREMILRQRSNDVARAVMVAYAEDADLDNLGALFGVERFIITPADPLTGTDDVLESDDDFRRRIVLAPEGYSVAGPEGAYIFHALSADADVIDASATSPDPGEVVVTVLSRSGDGTPAPAVLAAVEARLTDDNVRPMTDHVTVQAADIVDYAVEATLTFFAGPDRAIVLALAQSRLATYQANARRLGRDVTRAGIIAALCPEGVQNVELASPPADIPITRQQAGNCTGVTITDGGVGE